MTNEELASWLESTISDSGGYPSSGDDYFLEVAARLRNVTVRSDNSAVIAELHRRLKVAEDALMYARNSITRDCYNECDHIRECTSAHGRYECIVEDKIEDALAAIRKEGETK